MRKSVLVAHSWKGEEDHYSPISEIDPQEAEVFQDTLDGLRTVHADMNNRLEGTQNAQVEEFRSKICDTLSEVETDIGKLIQDSRGGSIDQRQETEVNPYMRTKPQDVMKSALVDLPYKVDAEIPEDHPPSRMKHKEIKGSKITDILTKTKVPKPKGLKSNASIVYEEDDPESKLKVVKIGDKSVVLREDEFKPVTSEEFEQARDESVEEHGGEEQWQQKDVTERKPKVVQKVHKKRKGLAEEVPQPEERQISEPRKMAKPSGPELKEASLLNSTAFKNMQILVPQIGMNATQGNAYMRHASRVKK